MKSLIFMLMLQASINTDRQQVLLDLLYQDCGSCHGMQLTGGLGPALSPDRMQVLGLENIKATILYGRPGTPMPPWQPFLSEEEAHWLANYLMQR